MSSYGGDVRMGIDTKIPNTTSNNNLSHPDFSTMSLRNQVIYIVKVACMIKFTLHTHVFIAQLYNFPNLKADRLYVIRSILYKPKLEKTQNLLQKDKEIHSYIAKYVYDLISKEMSSIRKFKSLKLKSF